MQGRLEEAADMYQRVLQGFEKTREPDHASTMKIAKKLGRLYEKQGKLDEAKKISSMGKGEGS